MLSEKGDSIILKFTLIETCIGFDFFREAFYICLKRKWSRRRCIALEDISILVDEEFCKFHFMSSVNKYPHWAFFEELVERMSMFTIHLDLRKEGKVTP